ncbi:MAG: nitric oxide reductase activation protein [Eubacteriales bacterium]|nr:nitric oxide reductase activation protein [Eubacteriales bacterium]
MEALPDEKLLDYENRIRNLLWTISGDYTLEIKPDLSLFLRSEAIALYNGIKQGAFARFYDKEQMGTYMIRKIYLQADETLLTSVVQLCIEEAIGQKICAERPGIVEMQRKAFTDILEQDFEKMPAYGDILGRLKIAVLRDHLDGETHVTERKIDQVRQVLYGARNAAGTMELIQIADELYNTIIDPDFERAHGDLEKVMSVSLREIADSDWKDFMSEELYEEALESYIENLTKQMTSLEDSSVTEKMEEQRNSRRKIMVVSEEALQKAHTYVELNFGKTYLSEMEEKRMNHLLCRGIHSDCSVYFTDGILVSAVKRNYQLEYAKKIKSKNIWIYHEKYRVARQNITNLAGTLKKSLMMRDEIQQILSDRGKIVPSRIWRLSRSSEATIFQREIKGDSADFVVDILIDASGSQMKRQGDVALQAYIISAALSEAGIPHRAMSYCTFWDYTIMHRFREYDAPKKEDENIFNYVTSSNNRDGLAIRAAGYGLLQREETHKILIILSDGRPYDVMVNRPNAKNPEPYHGKYAIADTATEIRKLRNLGVSVLGVFVGEEKDLLTERKIFGKDFAYIRNITGFSKIVGRYLTKQIEENDR